jgi:hypothetical protein
LAGVYLTPYSEDIWEDKAWVSQISRNVMVSGCNLVEVVLSLDLDQISEVNTRDH